MTHDESHSLFFQTQWRVGGPAGSLVTGMASWMGTHGYVYRRMFEADAQCVMTTHTALPAWSKKGDNGRWPIATYCSDLTEGLLKKTLGFMGAVVTDAMCMGGCAGGDQVQDSVDAFRSGADLLLWAPMEAGERIVAMLQSGEIPMSRLEDALCRIGRMRNFLETQRKLPPIDPDWVDEVFTRVYRKGICLVTNENRLIPFRPEDGKKLLAVGNALNETGMASMEQFCDMLCERGLNVDFRKYMTSCWEDIIHSIHKDYDAVLLLNQAPLFVANLCAAGYFRAPSETIWAMHLVPKEKRVVINFQSSLFIKDFFPEDQCIVQALPQRPGLEAAADLLEGKLTADGKIPYLSKGLL